MRRPEGQMQCIDGCAARSTPTQRTAAPNLANSVPSGIRTTARGCYPAGQGGNALQLDVSRGQWLIDVFSGTGGVARALRRQGYACKELELKKGFDILHRLSFVRLRSDVRPGKIAGVMIALPFTSFSIAQAGRLRSELHPLGLPGLPAHLQARVDHGNALLYASVQLIRTCVAHGVRWILENPASSYAFKTPALQELLRLGWCCEAVCVQCQIRH